jgi:DNA repair exonuclease SbcCD ATPase subunit/DNA repair exonuclease SbcCD nuclease subunit
MTTQLKCSISNFSNIFHIADIHIRLTKRHDEYQEVFQRLYTTIDKTPSTTVICVLGDLFHNKSDLSPECVEVASSFLKNLADRRPTVLIAGNHDATLANKNRMDSLSPIVNALQHDNLFYLRDTGTYILGDILFNNFSVFDEHTPEKYVKVSDIPKIYTRNANHIIGLYHGGVNDAITDIGFRVSNRSISNSLFDGHHIVLLGDIHKYQVLQQYNDTTNLPAIVYAGSLIQQNHGETLKGHGFVYWDLKTKAFKHFEVANDYGFYTIEINKGQLTTDISDIPKKTSLRVKCVETVGSEIKSVLSDLKNTTEVIDVTVTKVESDENNVVNIADTSDLNIHKLGDVDYQNQLICDYLKSLNKDIDEELLTTVVEINKSLNKDIKKEIVVRNIRWKPKKFEFDNMFSYGEGNVVDFTKMNGVMGLFAPNASGKSTILSALSFCVFDKCERSHIASDILNSKKFSFRCKFNFEVNGVDYFIEREGKADKKGAVKVDVKFYKTENGKEIVLNGEARRNTNDIIRDYLGTYEDFILTVLSIQNGKSGSFINMKQSERKDLLAQFMGLDVFDKLHDLAKERATEYLTLLKNLNKTDYPSELSVLTNNIETTQSVVNTTVLELEDAKKQRDELNESLIEETKKLVKITTFVGDITNLEKSKIKSQTAINSAREEGEKVKIQIDQYSVAQSELKAKIDAFVKNEVETKYTLHSQLKNELTRFEMSLENKKVVVTGKLDKLKKLQEHKYDPNCDFCVNNVFVKDAIKTKEDLENDKVEVKSVMSKISEIKSKIDEITDVVSQYQEYKTSKEQSIKLNDTINRLNNEQLRRENTITIETSNLEKYEQQITQYYESKDAIEVNVRVQSVIDKIKQSLKNVDFKISSTNRTLTELSGKIASWQAQKIKSEQLYEEVKRLEKQWKSYVVYEEAVSRDGLQYMLISKSLPEIEKEVNSILNQIVDFTLSLQTDGKNIITYIVYEDSKWKIELASGLEQFVSSLAIRVALINVSNLPRPNFIAIDEGFGCADSDNLAVMGVLFSYLKSNFDFIWIISHLDVMKDMVDTRIEINKDGGFSKINYQ